MTTTNTERGDALVMFGLTGDLGENKLFPALAELATEGLIEGPVLAVGRTERSDDELWDMFIDAVGDTARGLRGTLDLRYVQGDSAEAETFDEITAQLDGAERPVIYAALPPDLFAALAEQIAGSSLPDTTRLIVEKPFGKDAESAARLHEQITSLLSADRLFMVDHFLAKTSVENLLAFRAANPLFERALAGDTVRRIEFTMAEAFGVDGRGSFYDATGAIEDVVQNHILQTIAVLLMDTPAHEDPTQIDAADFDRCRADLLGAIRPIDTEAVVLGQFDGYLDIDDVADDSQTETFVACRLTIDSPRWDGVEIVLRTGKELSDTYTEAVVVFSDEADAPSRLRFRLKPDQCISLDVAMLQADAPAEDGHSAHCLTPATLEVVAPSGHGALSDYATILEGGLAGDQRHFARIDDTKAAWRIVEPLLSLDRRPEPYEKGSMGPAQADGLLSTGRWISGPAF